LESIKEYAKGKAQYQKSQREEILDRRKDKEMTVTITDIPAERMTFEPGELQRIADAKKKVVSPPSGISVIEAEKTFTGEPVTLSFWEKSKQKVQELWGQTGGPEAAGDIKKGVLKYTQPLIDIPFLAFGRDLPSETEIPQDFVVPTEVAYTPGASMDKLFATSPGLTRGEQKKVELQEKQFAQVFRAEGRIRDEVEYVIGDKAKELSSELQRKINEGKITYEDAVKESAKLDKQLAKEAEAKVEKIIKEETDLSQKEINEMVEKYEEEIAPTMLQKVGVGATLAISTAIPYVGPVIGASLKARLAVSAPDITRGLIEDPFGTLKEAGPYVAGAIIGGAIVSGGRALSASKGKYNAQSIDFSVSNALKVGPNLWKVSGVVKTVLKDTKTGKISKVIETKTFSDVVTSSFLQLLAH